MNPELEQKLKQMRKRDREVLELNKLRDRLSKLKNPDPKILAAIDAEIKARDL